MNKSAGCLKTLEPAIGEDLILRVPAHPNRSPQVLRVNVTRTRQYVVVNGPSENVVKALCLW